MALETGTRLGPYQILGAIGAGGMGEVYRARDTRLDRTVAIKVLAPALADDAGLRERFEREARAISALNHPHICTLFDIGESPSTAGGDPFRFLVLEHLEGRTLAERLTAGALPATEALTYATQIADALDKAHRAGIVHRDLKPANVMITKAGAKLLDFGLAKSAAPVVATSGLSMLPTTPPALTQQGTILGTFQYMAPEQIEGLEADARTDIFAFGALAFEMLTGRTAFEGKTRAALLGAILKDDPPRPSSLTQGVPPTLDRVISTCLAKEPDDRYQSARDLHRDLQWATSPEASVSSAAVPSTDAARQSWSGWVVAAIATAGFVAASVVAVRHFRETPSVPPSVRFPISVPDLHTFGGPTGGGSGAATQFAVSPDGQHVVFVTRKDTVYQLWVRSLDSVTARLVPGTEGAAFPFWSPDSRWLGFFADGKLKKLQITASSPLALCDAPVARGGTWSPDGSTILFAPSASGPLQRVSSAGGTPTTVSALDAGYGESNHRFPHFLPDGQHYLFTAVTGPAGSSPRPSRIKVGFLASTESTPLIEVESSATFAAGHLFFHRDRALMAQPFDAATRTLTGEPFPAVETIGTEGSRYVSFSASAVGTLAYAGGGAFGSQLVWRDRSGKHLGTLGDVAFYSSVVLSPDGSRAVVAITSGSPQNRDVWTIDIARNNASRLTFNPGDDGTGVWSPDGSRIVFNATRDGIFGLRLVTVGGTGADELLFKADRPVPHTPTDWSSDGRYILYTQGAPPATDIYVLPMTGDRKPIAIAQTPFTEDGPTFSPDGRWIAYSSNESGIPRVYVQPFPLTERKYLVSQTGGSQPIWRADGRELYFLAPDATLYAVAVTPGAQFESGIPQRLFVAPTTATVGGRRQYGTRDGKQFLFISPPPTAESTPITVVTNWRPER